MTVRGATTQGGLAALGLILAYTTWQREPERTTGEVVVFEASKNDIEKIRYEDDKKWAELERGKAPDEVWVKVSGSEDGKTPERTLKGNQTAEKLLGNFAPLRASRALGSLDAGKFKELGFEGTKKKLEVSARGQKVTFVIAQPGFGSPYLKSERDGKVFLLASSVTSDLESASGRLVERTLHDFKPAEFDGLMVTAGSKKREFIHKTTGEGAAASQLAPKNKPDKPDGQAKNWHDRLWRSVATEVLGKDEPLPNGAKPQPLLRVEYMARKKQKGWIELVRLAPTDGPKESTPENPHAPPKPAVDIYARTEHTIGWVKLPATADEVLKEADKVVAAD